MNKNILVTGASRGIGRQIAIGLSKAGNNVFVTSRSENLLNTLAEETDISGICVCDLSNPDDFSRLKLFIQENKINVVINNAGDYIYSGIDEVSYEQIFKINAVNLLAPEFICSVAAAQMKSIKWGRIINIGSISGVMGEPFASLYSASKAGLIGLTKALALELAEYKVTVNTINPGWVETDLCQKSIEDSAFCHQEILDTIPQKRFVKPEEIEKLIEYLISDNARGITGQSINLCAGLSLGI